MFTYGVTTKSTGPITVDSFNSFFDPFSDLMFKRAFDETFCFPKKKDLGYPVDLYMLNEDSLCIDIAAVNIDIKDIDITIKDDILRVLYDNKKPKEDTDEKSYILNGITHKSFDFSWKINTTKCDLESINAELERGLLHIVIPFKEETQKKKIEIKQK
ncbi:MAG: Hsp20 family protein [Candidatus Pacearchaeota archaeon]